MKRFLTYLDGTRSIQLFQALRFGAQFLIGVLLAKTALSTAQIGLFDTFLFVATSISFFWVSGFINALLPLYATTHEEGKPVLLFNAFLVVFVLNLLVCTVLYLFAGPFFQKVYPEGNFPYLIYLLVFLFVNNPAFLIEYILLLKNRPKALAAYGIFIFVLQLSATVLPVLLGYGLDGAIKGLVLFGIVKFGILAIVMLKYSVATLDVEYLKQHTRLAWPLALSIFVSGSGDLVDGYLVSTYFDRATFAIFRYGARELPVALLLANAFSSSALPRVAENLQESLSFIKDRSRQMMHLLFPLSIILLLTSRYLYPIVFRPQFAASVPVFNIFLLLLVSRMVFPQTILNGLKQTRPILAFTIIELSVNIIFSVVLMHSFGIVGVAWGTVIAYTFDKILTVSYNRIRNGIPIQAYTDLKVLGGYSILLVLAYISTLFC